MQKVEGSSPFIRFSKAPQTEAFVVHEVNAQRGVAAKWLHTCRGVPSMPTHPRQSSAPC
jgi:hypothetical protein